MSTITTSQIIDAGSVAHHQSAFRNDKQLQIESINRQNYRTDFFVKCLAIFLMSAVAVSFVSLIGYGLYEVAQHMAGWNIQDLGRVAVGY